MIINIQGQEKLYEILKNYKVDAEIENLIKIIKK
jgi:hypothetical protein